jgi:hypothetical protein
MMKRIALLIALIALFASTFTATPAPARAQGGEAIKYGASVEGEITEDADSASYTFDGKKDELAFVQLILIEGDDDISTLDAVMQLKDPKGKVIADTGEGDFTVTGAFADALSLPLPSDGKYTIDIKPSEDADDKEKVGKYILQLVQPEVLTPGKAVDATAKYKGYSRFLGVYQVKETSDFILSLTADGKTRASIQVHEFNEDIGFLNRIGADGRGLKGVDLLIEAPDEFYLVTVSADGVLFDETDIKYTVTLKAAK